MQTTSNVIDQETEITLTPEERQPCEIWTRVMGYHRPVSSFNRGKQGEFHERNCFREVNLD
jgi:anaerobic ribonucleoside-triphosphate reductase